MSDKPKKAKAPPMDAAAKEAAAKVKNDAIAAAVKAMDMSAQSSLLSQALLREYMHRKGYKRTLAVFDEESPRTDTTISSRQLMASLMELQTIQDRNQERKEPMATIMDMLCSYRLRKRDIIRRRQEGDAERPYDSSDEEADVAARVAEAEAARDKARSDTASTEGKKAKKAKKASKEVQEEEGEKKMKKKKKKKDVNGEDIDALFAVTADKPQKAPKRSAASYNRSANDILKNAMDALSTLPLSSNTRSGITYSRGWTPGATDAGGDGAPQVGLSHSQSPDRSFRDDAEPHSFLAGDGFNLSFNQPRLSIERPALHVSPTSTPTHPHGEDFKVSPRTSLVGASHGSPSATRAVGNTGGSTSAVSAAQLLGQHHDKSGGQKSSNAASKRQGMSFADAMAQASTDSGGVSPANSLTGSTSGRNRRRVTILADEAGLMSNN